MEEERKSVATEAILDQRLPKKQEVVVSAEKTLELAQIMTDFLKSCNSSAQKTSNDFKNKILRLDMPANFTVTIPPQIDFIQQLRDFFDAFYFVRSFDQPSQYYLMFSLCEFFPRKRIDNLVIKILKMMMPENTLNLVKKNAMQSNNRIMSTYSREITNGHMGNMYICYNKETQDQIDQSVAHTSKLHIYSEMYRKQFVKEFSTICKFPIADDCDITGFLQLPIEERTSRLKDGYATIMFQNVKQFAHQLTMASLLNADPEFKAYFDEFNTQQALIDSCITQDLQLMFQSTIFGIDNKSVLIVHPHPLSIFREQAFSYQNAGVLDLMVYNADTILNFLRVAQWFSQVVLTNYRQVDNNHASLLCYGAAGAGKSLLLKAMSQAFGSYCWSKDTGFQNPDLAYKSSMFMEEVALNTLIQSQMKNVLDFQAFDKVNYKNKDPHDCTQYMPVTMSTNDNLFETIQNFKYQQGQRITQESIQGAFRRVFQVYYMQSFNRAYPQQDFNKEYSIVYKPFNDTFLKNGKDDKKTFNTIYALACLMPRTGPIHIPVYLGTYTKRVVQDLYDTHFMCMFTQQKKEIFDCVYLYDKYLHDFMGKTRADIEDYIKALNERISKLIQVYMFEKLSPKPDYLRDYMNPNVAEYLKKSRMITLFKRDLITIEDQVKFQSSYFTDLMDGMLDEADEFKEFEIYENSYGSIEDRNNQMDSMIAQAKLLDSADKYKQKVDQSIDDQRVKLGKRVIMDCPKFDLDQINGQDVSEFSVDDLLYGGQSKRQKHDNECQ